MSPAQRRMSPRQALARRHLGSPHRHHRQILSALKRNVLSIDERFGALCLNAGSFRVGHAEQSRRTRVREI
jgi:hypothetical protein